MYILLEEIKCLDDNKFKIKLKLLLFDLIIYDIKEFILYLLPSECNAIIYVSYVNLTNAMHVNMCYGNKEIEFLPTIIDEYE